MIDLHKTHSELNGTYFGTYSLTLQCSNCNETNIYQILKGSEYGSVACVNCGCSSLTKVSK